MKRHETDKYSARALHGGHYLYTHSETLNGVKREIDESNERAVRRGYKAEQWLITHVEHYSWYDGDGMFVKSEEYEQAVGVYPEELKGDKDV